MAKFIINGSRLLGGEVRIGGSKNTILPLIAACLLTDETCVITNVPAISDVETMLAIAEELGVSIEWDRPNHRVVICAKNFSSASPDAALSKKLRGSILFAGALLGRLKSVTIPYPGGDAIGARPLETHFHALETLGVRVDEHEKIRMDAAAIAGADLTLEEPSVTATENTILASVLAPGRTIIRLAAIEPHVQELVRFLVRMGANIRWREMNRLEVEGVQRLHGARAEVNPDEQEISCFAVLAAATRSEVTLVGVEPDYLDAVFLQFRKMGIGTSPAGQNRLTIMKPGGRYQGFRIQAGLYPKLGADHLPPFAVLATQAEGESLIHDWLYENRLRYIPELQKMGADCIILDPHRARITGPTPLHAAKTTSLDIRAGMTIVIAALVAEGQSVISDIQHLDRGYEAIEERLRGIGADIQRTAD